MKSINHKGLVGVLVVALFVFCASMFIFPANSAAEGDYLWEFKFHIELESMMEWVARIIVKFEIYQGDIPVFVKYQASSPIKKGGSLSEPITVSFENDHYSPDITPGTKATKYVVSLYMVDSGSETYVIKKANAEHVAAEATQNSDLIAHGSLSLSNFGEVIYPSTLTMIGYGIKPTTIPTAPLSMIGYKPKYNFKFKLPFTTDALEMTGVKSKKPKFSFDFGDIDEDAFDERKASPEGRRQGRQPRLQQPGVLRTNEPAPSKSAPKLW